MDRTRKGSGSTYIGRRGDGEQWRREGREKENKYMVQESELEEDNMPFKLQDHTKTCTHRVSFRKLSKGGSWRNLDFKEGGGGGGA